MNNKVIADLNKILNELGFDFMYTIDEEKIKLIIFMED